jgi:hypothetical protein
MTEWAQRRGSVLVGEVDQPHYQLRGMVLSEAVVRAIARERNYKCGWIAHFLREQAARPGGAA